MHSESPTRARNSISPAALLLALTLAQPLAAEGAGRWSLCGPQQSTAAPQLSSDPQAPIEFSAERAEFEPEGISTLSGEVEILQGGRRLTAGEALYDHRRQSVEAHGAVNYSDGALEVSSDAARLDLRSSRGSFDNVRYRLPEQHAHGTATRITRRNRNLTTLEQVRYTTCNPGRVDWQLRASEIRLNRELRMGTARNVSVWFRRVPLFYFPYLAFPITDQRMSGFLMPDIRLDLSRGASDIAVPYYWNMAPNYDATITPRFISQRGPMLGLNLRYLGAGSRGQLEAGYLPDDRLYGSTRSMLRLRYHTIFSSRWSGAIDYNHVSDADYFLDMGDSFNPNTTTHQERRLTLTYRDHNWQLSGMLLGYQMLLGGATPPYQKLPQIGLRYIGRQRDNSLSYHLGAEYIYFDDDARQPTGSRLHVGTGISFPLHSTATFLVPRLTLQHTIYQLDKTPGEMASTPERTLPVFSLDGGLFLERMTSWGERTMLQTLEPRLFYLYVPYRDQSGLPNFDTAAYTFDYAQLFRENRFTNVDRISDANQLSVGLTTRFLESGSGLQRLSASIGQIVYFEPRRVTLKSGDSGDDSGSSDAAAELTLRLPDHWSFGSSLIWDPRSERSRRLSGRLQYRRDAGHLFTIDYRHQYNPQSRSYRYRQLDLSGVWAVSGNWHLLGHWNYDLDADQTRETLIGIGYNSCCWAARLVSREFRKESEAELDRAIFVNLELKGLSSINGEQIDYLLKDGILGYSPLE